MSLGQKVYAPRPPHAEERRFADAQSLIARVSEVLFSDSWAPSVRAIPGCWRNLIPIPSPSNTS